MLLLLLLAACASPPGDTGGSSTVRWSGSVLDGPYTGDEPSYFTGGSFELWDAGGSALLAEGVEGEAGQWRVDAPPGREVAIRLSGGNAAAAALWRGTTPERRAYWFTGALFAYSQEWVDWLLQLDGEGGVHIDPLDADTAWFWGTPLEPEDWGGVSITLTSPGGEATVLRYALVDGPDGPALSSSPLALASRLDDFFAFDLPPGELVLRVDFPDGRSFEERYPVQGGEVVSAWFLAAPAR